MDATISPADNSGKRGNAELSEKDLDKATGGIVELNTEPVVNV
jgi:hypothetical protein